MQFATRARQTSLPLPLNLQRQDKLALVDPFYQQLLPRLHHIPGDPVLWHQFDNHI